MRTRDRVALAAVALALTAAGVLLGGSTRWAALSAAALALAAAAVHVTSRRTASTPGPLVGLVLVAVVATAAQLVPLPRALAAIVAGDKLTLVTDHASALGEAPPTWVVASHDPPATLVELAKLCGYLALAWACTRIASQRRARPWLAATVVAAAGAVAVVALAHRVLGATALYGVWRLPAKGMVPAPLINENHLAALTAMAVPLAAGLGLSWRGRRRALAWGAALILATTVALTSSRGGLVGLVAGLAVAGVVLVAQRRAGLADDHRPAPLAVAAPALVVAACALTLFGVVAAKDVALELGDTQLTELSDQHSKYQVWRAAAPMIVDNRWLGIGRGSFEQVFPRHAQVGDVTFSHAENSYLQAVIDWGVLAAAALAVALALLGRAAVRRWRHGPLEAGALGALAAMAIHELADFSLELPAVAMAVIATAAVVAPIRLGTDDKRLGGPRDGAAACRAGGGRAGGGHPRRHPAGARRPGRAGRAAGGDRARRAGRRAPRHGAPPGRRARRRARRGRAVRGADPRAPAVVGRALRTCGRPTAGCTCSRRAC
ncbi:MAG: O-antigen ligase family protein [Kofleriaceae bacterium]